MLVSLYLQEHYEDKQGIDVNAPVFFAKQVINNACGTQALINILMNRPEVEVGDVLTNFKGFAEGLPADMRGMVIGNSDDIRVAHNSFARPEPFIEGPHFVSFSSTSILGCLF